MGMSFVQCEGYTTKKGITVTTTPNAKDPSKPLSYAFVTLMQKRDYEQTVKDANGKVVYEADGKTPKKEKVSDAITLKFRNSAAEAIAKYKPDGTARRLWVKGTLATYETEDENITVKDENGKYIQSASYVVINGKAYKKANITKHTIVEVDEWRFLDSNTAANVAAIDAVAETLDVIDLVTDIMTDVLMNDTDDIIPQLDSNRPVF